MQLAACLLVVLTVFTFEKLKHDDILLAIATRRPIEAGERDEMKSNLERLSQYPKASNDLLLRIYKAADALAAHVPAEEAAKRLADRLEEGRLSWMLTYARQLMQNSDYQAANAAFDKVLSERPEREFSLEERAEIYIEAARAAAALKNLDNAIALYDESFNLQSPDDKTKREYSGVLTKAGRYDQAVAVIEPLKDAESRLLLASILETQGKNQRALSVLLDLEKAQTIDDNAKQTIARLLLADRKCNVAAERLIDLLKKQPDDKQIQRMFIDAVAASSRRSDAVRQAIVDVFQKYQETGFQSLDVEGYLRLGDALRQLELYKEAGIVLTKAVAEYPDNNHLRLRLAQTLASLGQYDKADMQYKILLDSQPSPSR
jgi:tetratricopeptide (TPR) repeat protein